MATDLEIIAAAAEVESLNKQIVAAQMEHRQALLDAENQVTLSNYQAEADALRQKLAAVQAQVAALPTPAGSGVEVPVPGADGNLNAAQATAVAAAPVASPAAAAVSAPSADQSPTPAQTDTASRVIDSTKPVGA